MGNTVNLPNLVTSGRILAAPLVTVLLLQPRPLPRILAFVLFLVAALSDLWDGHLARSRDQVTAFGKIVDPLADKLLLVATLIPFYLVSHRPGALDDVPGWGPLPLWVLVVIFGRELTITVFRAYAAGRGVVIAAGRSGKLKALVQSLFAGGLLFWYPISRTARARGWESTGAWEIWSVFNRSWVWGMLALALVLTIYSLIDYLWSYRTLMGARD